MGALLDDSSYSTFADRSVMFTHVHLHAGSEPISNPTSQTANKPKYPNTDAFQGL